ncbi:MFS transporter [Pseudomonas protegens]|uniref:MFS transporter n=1 Tax=Pseudomonas protegens TaxID=380021 RepID=UPI000D99FD57|nr:MFS transporter [Pseudomonas protegens]PYB95947.1 MFS transporter [Pseudomonas protegens]ROL90954.1 LysR family transcriptional regulator [Pseudomonas protegens]ROM00659.1 LysR family transcriptional regulator [Pseudomonas protegens]ROM07184.1 LysR family transcriptional regulator [Pseudomonas protegens]ROM08278.1 LysR family transcriptional regulator [Pseudomonas protegens]
MKPSASPQPRRAAAAAFIGTMIEWYDFYIYATAAALVFGALFFPSDDKLFSTMAAFGTFAVGFFARPLGGIIFGHIGDRIGRKKSLVITLLMMGVVTVGIGLLPTYAQIGALAPVLLILLRIVQGIAVGGEWGGAVLMAGEHAPKGRRNFFASFAQLGSPAGLILSLLAFSAVTRLPEDALMSWGWRLPFLASALLLLVGLAIRLGVNESPEFLASREQAAKSLRKEQAPVMQVLRTAWRPLLLCIGANTLGIAGVYFTNTFMIAYTTQQLEIPRSLILECLFVVAIIQFCIQPLAAWSAEKIGATRFLCLVSVLAMASPYPMFVLVSSGQAPLMILGIALAVVCMASFYAVIAGYVSGMFETRVRYTAISLAYQVCGALAGGLTPLIGTWLAHRFIGQWWPMALFYSLIAAVSLICVLALSRRHAHAHRLEMASHA